MDSIASLTRIAKFYEIHTQSRLLIHLLLKVERAM